jgi:hypothetical protein
MGYMRSFSFIAEQPGYGRVGEDIWRNFTKYVAVAEVAHVPGQLIAFDSCPVGNLIDVHLGIANDVRHVGLDTDKKGSPIMKLDFQLAIAA